MKRFMTDEQIELLKTAIVEGRVKSLKKAIETLELALVNKVFVSLESRDVRMCVYGCGSLTYSDYGTMVCTKCEEPQYQYEE